MSEEKEEVKPVQYVKAKGSAMIVSLRDVTSRAGNHNIAANIIAKVAIGGELVYKDPTWSIRIEGIGSNSEDCYFNSLSEDFRLATPKEIEFYKERLKEDEFLVELPVFEAGDEVECPEVAYTTNYSRTLKAGTRVIVEDVVISQDPYNSVFFVKEYPNGFKIMDFKLCQRAPQKQVVAQQSDQENTESSLV